MSRANKSIKFINLLAIIILSQLVLLTCSGDNTSSVEPDITPVSLTVTPASGMPGTLLNISGYTVNPADSGIDIYIGGELSVFLQDSSGLQTVIPLFLDSASHWPAPPSGTLDVEIRENGTIVAIAKSAVTVDTLQHADGATATIQQDFMRLANSLQTIWSSLPAIPGEDSAITGFRQAIMTMLDSTLTGTDSSLASVLAGTSSWTNGQAPDLALIDALLASSGALEFYNDAAGSLGRLTDSLTLAYQQGALCRGGGADMDLACQMQIYVLLNDYATYFVKPTSEGYANTIGLVAGLVAISGYSFPPEKIISALMVVFDFVYGTLAPSLFPANITEFSLTVATDTIAVDEYTNTAVLVAASNNPATIRATDMLEKLLTALGLANAPGHIAESFREVLVNAMKWALGLYRQAIEAYNTNNSIFIDPEADLPQMSWGPVMVSHADLVELYSFTEDIINADDVAFEWKGISRGEGQIQARGRGAGERSKVLYDNALCLGCVYYGGAFGNNAPGTEIKTVVVGKPATLDVQITGLPDGSRAIVHVYEPNGHVLTVESSMIFTKREPGDYRLIAIEVYGSDDLMYKPNFIDTTVTLDEGEYVTVTVAYEPKYGSLLLTVAGLPYQTDADIDVTGPSGTIHVAHDTLMDTLSVGDYTITAQPVMNPFINELVYPDPNTQTITVYPNETATAAVEYGDKATLRWAIGTPDRIDEDDWQNRPLSVVYGSAESIYSPPDSPLIYQIDSADGRSRPPLLSCISGEIDNGLSQDRVSFTASTPGGSANAEMFLYQGSDSVVKIDFRASGLPGLSGTQNASITNNGLGTIVFVNPGPGPATLRYRYHVSISGTTRVYIGVGTAIPTGPECLGLGDPYYANKILREQTGTNSTIIFDDTGDAVPYQLSAGLKLYVPVFLSFEASGVSINNNNYEARIDGTIEFFIQTQYGQ